MGEAVFWPLKGRFRFLPAAGFLAALCGMLHDVPRSSAAPCTSLALVLSVDSSSSVTDREFAFEKRGLAGALRDKDVLASLLVAGPAKVATLFWGDAAFGTATTGWHLIRDASDAEKLAEATEEAPRRIAGETDIGSGLDAALDLLSRPDACAGRQIVNITGDGRETVVPRRRSHSVSVPAARVRAQAMGVVVNGLAITSEEPALAEYYRRYVITGPGAFVMEIAGVEDYAAAIREKIIRETRIFVAGNN